LKKAMEDCSYDGAIKTLTHLSAYNPSKFEEIISLALGRSFKAKVRFECAVMCQADKPYYHEIYDIAVIDANIAGKLLKTQDTKMLARKIAVSNNGAGTYQQLQASKIQDMNRDIYGASEKMDVCANNLDRYSKLPDLSTGKTYIMAGDAEAKNTDIVKETQAALILLGHKVTVNGKLDNDTQAALKTALISGYDVNYDGSYISSFVLQDMKNMLQQRSFSIKSKVVNPVLYNAIRNKK